MTIQPRVRVDGFFMLLGASAALLYLALRSSAIVAVGFVVLACLLLAWILILLAIHTALVRYQLRIPIGWLGPAMAGILFGTMLLIAGATMRSLGLSLLIGLGASLLIDWALWMVGRDKYKRVLIPILGALAVLVIPPTVPIQALSAERVAGFLFLAGILRTTYDLANTDRSNIISGWYFYLTLATVLFIYMALSLGRSQVLIGALIVLAVAVPAAISLAAQKWLVTMVATMYRQADQLPAGGAPAWFNSLARLAGALGLWQSDPAGQQRELPEIWRDRALWSTKRHRELDQIVGQLRLLLDEMTAVELGDLELPADFPKHLKLYVVMSLVSKPSHGMPARTGDDASYPGPTAQRGDRVSGVAASGQAAQFRNTLARFAAQASSSHANWVTQMGLVGGQQEADEFVILLRWLRERGRLFELVDLAQIYLEHFPELPGRMAIEAELAHGEYEQVVANGWARPIEPQTTHPPRPNPDRPQLRIVNQTVSMNRVSGVECRVLVCRQACMSFDLARGEGTVISIDDQPCQIIICPYDWRFAPVQVEWCSSADEIVHQAAMLVSTQAIATTALELSLER
jgi:hypothetical protein